MRIDGATSSDSVRHLKTLMHPVEAEGMTWKIVWVMLYGQIVRMHDNWSLWLTFVKTKYHRHAELSLSVDTIVGSRCFSVLFHTGVTAAQISRLQESELSLSVNTIVGSRVTIDVEEDDTLDMLKQRLVEDGISKRVVWYFEEGGVVS